MALRNFYHQTSLPLSHNYCILRDMAMKTETRLSIVSHISGSNMDALRSQKVTMVSGLSFNGLENSFVDALLLSHLSFFVLQSFPKTLSPMPI